jgi:thiol-disulfide isomerase/thioredoxin
LALAGCSTFFGKKSKDRANPQAQPPADTGRVGSSGAIGIERTGGTEVNGILAGRVVDTYDNRPPPTFIQVIAGSAGKETKGAPIEVVADAQGYFTIHGLQPGQHYQLIARTREGEHKMAGSAWGIPPNARLLIYMSEDFATGNTPAPPGDPVIPGQKAKSKNARSSSSNDQGETNRESPKPSTSIPPQRPVDIGKPMKTNDQDQNPPTPTTGAQSDPRSSIRPEDIVRDSGGLVATPPVASIPFQGNRIDSPRADSRSAQPVPPITTRVPSCVLTGRQLDNFALNDLNAQPWEYRNRRGRIVLLDFWATYCLPCRQAIPSLKILQERYGRFGLEVVGIAYEDGTLPEQIRKVQNVRENLGINYQLLLGSDIYTCPVKAQFAIDKFPTLVLIDQNSRIIWRSEGLDNYKIQELEMLIKQQLNVR